MWSKVTQNYHSAIIQSKDLNHTVPPSYLRLRQRDACERQNNLIQGVQLQKLTACLSVLGCV